MKNKKFILISSVCAVLVTALTIGACLPKQSTTSLPIANASAVQKEAENILSVNDNTDVDKSETVYVIADANCAVKKVIVSDWLKNPDKKEKLTDKSELKNIENVKGNETYKIDKDGMKVWDANGKDIYYQGSTDKELPVDVSITYFLDGKEISPKQLAGKSGRVEMKFNFKNNQVQKVEIDGVDTDIFVPFAVLTGTILPNDTFENVTVSNGKLINDGDKSVVMGFALPGLTDSLGIEKNKLNIPESVTVSADVKNFSLTTIMTYVSNEIFSGLNFAGIENADDLSSKLDEMFDGVNQLADGSSQLYIGLKTLLSKSGELVDGVNQLADGAKQLKDGTTQLVDGTKQLKNGMNQLNDGLKELTNNNALLMDGAKTIVNAVLDVAQQQIEAKGVKIEKLTLNNYKKVLGDLLKKVGRFPSLKKQLNDLITQLDGLKTFYNGLKAYTDGVAQAYDGSKQLNDGANTLAGASVQLDDGVKQLKDGIDLLKSSCPQLVDGVTQLTDGAMQLSDGIKMLKEEGIEKISDAFGGDVASAVTRLKAISDVAKTYQSFSGIADGMNGTVKFIYRTEAIG